MKSLVTVDQKEEYLMQHKLKNYGYETKEKIGKGGYATCFRVWSQKYNQTFVCKAMHIPTSYGSIKKRQEVIRAYELELEALTKMFNPHIVSIYKNIKDGDDLFLILEDCNQGSLDSLLRKKKVIDPHSIISYLKQIVDALKCCHKNKIAHRDIKPANILLHDGVVKLADFGLAITVDHNVEYLAGSVPYMSPEMFSTQAYDPIKSDIWSLGVSIYVLSLGKHPFHFKTIPELVEKMNFSKVEVPYSLHPAIQRLIKHTMVVDPNMRWDIDQIALFLDQIPTPEQHNPSHSTNNIMMPMTSDRATLLTFRATNITRASRALANKQPTKASTLPRL